MLQLRLDKNHKKEGLQQERLQMSSIDTQYTLNCTIRGCTGVMRPYQDNDGLMFWTCQDCYNTLRE